MQIIADGVILRHFFPSDREALVRNANNINVSKWLTDKFPHPYRLSDADSWIAQAATETRQCNFAIEWQDKLVGGIGLEPMTNVHSGTAGIGYWVGEDYWGMGLATRAVAAMLPYALDDLLFIRVQALVFKDNLPSMKVLEKNGFAREGTLRKHIRKNGVITDAVLYAKLRNP